MKKYFLFLLLVCFVTSTRAANQQVVEFDVLKAIYKGEGNIEIVNDSGMYDIKITGMGSSSNINSLTILPQAGRKKAPNFTHINLIYGDGSFKKIQVKFPPGKGERSSYIRNIAVSGSVDKLSIEGGDLGATDLHDGKVDIDGNVKSIIIKGKKYKNSSNVLEWWGGDIWANIEINGFLQKLLVKGGNINLDEQGGVIGKIISHGVIKQLVVKGFSLKNENNIKELHGGGVCVEIDTNERELQKLLVKGGVLIGGKIKCQQLKNLKIIGQDPLNPASIPISFTKSGIFNSQILTFNSGTLPSDLIHTTVKNGTIRDNIFTAYGDVKTVKVTGKTGASAGNISNTVVRAGLNGDLSHNNPPEISPETALTDIPTDGKIVVPFSVISDDTNEILTVYVDNYETIFDAVISNYNGEIFSATNRWQGTSPMYGMLVCESTGAIDGVVVRALDNGTPFKYFDMTVNIGGVTTNAAPSISLTPSDNPREINLTETNDFSWQVSIKDNNANQPVTFTIEEDPIGLTLTQLSQRDFIVSAENVSAGTYSNVTFKVVDDGGLSDTKSLTVIITNIYSFNVYTSLENNKIDLPVNSNLTFDIIAKDNSSSSFNFLDLTNGFITDNIYSNAVFYGTSATNYFNWTPTELYAGENQFEFKVLNSHGATGAVVAVVNVELPEADFFSSLSSTNFSWLAGDTLSFYIIAKDEKTNDFKFIAPSNLPEPNIYFNAEYYDKLSASNEFLWTPESDAAGIYDFDFAVIAESASETVTGHVYITIDLWPKEPLVYSSLPGNQYSGTPGNPVDFHVIAENYESTVLTFIVPTNLPSGANYIASQFNGVTIQSNQFTWTPDASQTSEWNISFPVVNSAALTGTVEVTLNISPTAFATDFDSGWTKWLEPREDATFKVADVNSVSCVGDAYDNFFICGLKQDDIHDTNWSNQYTIYQGKVKRVKLKGKALGNTIVSEKKVSASKEPQFYQDNEVWIDGQRATDKNQKF